MRVLLVHPSALMYSELYLRLEPLGLERVAAAVRTAGHDVRLLDLQIFTHDDYRRELVEFKPEAVGFSLNYLANVPEVIDLAKETRRRAPDCFIMVGGHSGSFIAPELLEHGEGAIDCVVRGEGEVIAPRVLEARRDAKLSTLPGVVPRDGHGFAIGQELERRRVRKQYYLETRCDVLIKNKELFAYWKKLGLFYMFLGLEALDEEALKLHRKRITPGENFKALEIAREIGLTVAVNIIADCDWDERRFELVREWAMTVPEIVHLTVATPYPGTEIWFTEARRLTSRDYRLFDVAHAVLPTRMPLDKFYAELVKTQDILNRKHLGWSAIPKYGFPAVRALLRGQTNYVKMLSKFASVVNEHRQYDDHQRPVTYEMKPPRPAVAKPDPAELFIHMPAS